MSSVIVKRITSKCYSILVVIQSLSHIRLFATLWTGACQAPLSMVFSRQEYWSGLPYPPPGDLPDPDAGLIPNLLCLLHSQVGSLAPVPPGKPKSVHMHLIKEQFVLGY